MAASLQKVVTVEGDNSGLIRLGNIGKNTINHSNQHSIFPWMSSIFDYWNNICSFFTHIQQITTRSMRKLDCIDETCGADNVRHVGDSRTTCSAKVQYLKVRVIRWVVGFVQGVYLFAWSHVNIIDATKNCSSEFRSERIP